MKIKDLEKSFNAKRKMKKEKIAKIDKDKLISKKAGLSYLQISILIIASFAFAYLVCQASEIEILPEVSAQAVHCCSITNSGDRCQEDLSTDIQNNCNGTIFPGRCSDFSECKIGCCFNPTEGNCVANSPKGKCEGEGGEWDNDGACNIAKCEKGCCLLGGEARFVTSKNCEVLSSSLGFEKIFRPEIKTEVSCIILSELQDKGACVLDSGSERTCKFTTRQECISLAGNSDNFVKNSLCTNPELNTTCKKTQETTCVEGKDEVYFVDSCGNPANIYDSSKINDNDYWKEIIFKTETCGAGGSNTESKTCGNCDGLESKCKNYAKAKVNKPSYGDNICADLSCKNAPANGGGKQDRKNLESWCVYDGKIGNGDDVAGSRHFKYVCVEGEIQVEPCADFRNELCVESRDSNADFSTASCRINQWQKCIDANSKENKGGACTGIDCQLVNINIDKDFKFDICTPKYPEGFDLKNPSSGNEICGIASTKCTVIYVKEMFGGWKCKVNCNCEKAIFTQQMNDVCRKLGDCGGYVNIEGVYTDIGYSVVGAPKAISQSYAANAIAVAGQKAEPGTLEQLTGGSTSQPTEPAGVEGSKGGEVSVGALAAAGAGTLGVGYLLSQYGGGIAGVFGGGASVPVTYTGISQVGTEPFIGVTFDGILGPVHYNIPAEGSAIDAVLYPNIPGSGGALDIGSTFEIPIDTPLLDASGSPVGSTAGEFASAEGISTSSTSATTTGITGAQFLSAFANLAMVTGIIMSIAPLIAQLIGIRTTQTGMIAGTIAGVGTVYIEALAFNEVVLGGGAISPIEVLMSPLEFGGPIILIEGIIVAIIIMALFKAAGVGKTKKVIVTFTCKPWQAPTGGGSCSSCDKDVFKSCSKYRCDSLGQSCQFLNEGTDQEICSHVNPTDTTPPRISPLYEAKLKNTEYTEVSDFGFKITNTEDEKGCVQEYTPLLFGIKTDEPSHCRMDVKHTANFDEMLEDFGGINLLIENHTMMFSLPSASSLANQLNISTQLVLDVLGDLNFYVRCRDSHGNTNPAEFAIKMCVKEGPDLTAPRINAISPENNGIIKYGQEEQSVKLWLNEPSECKYDIANKNYDAMKNSMNCAVDLEEQEVFGWPCNFVFKNLTSSENKIFIRCKDQPELAGINETARNTMTESYEYVLKKSSSELKIDYISPSEKVSAGTEPVSVTLEVLTSGGALNGQAKCRWEIRNWGWEDYFFNTWSTIHTSTLSTIFRGDYNLYVRCEDIAGNVAEDSTDFTVEIDNTPPRITRVLYRNGLQIITNEDAVCGYSFTDKNCGFDLDSGNATLMSGTGKEHTADWQTERTYYIKCRDVWGREPGGCSIKIRPYDII